MAWPSAGGQPPSGPPALTALRAGLARGAAIRLTVVSGSMRPLLRPGDAVWLAPAGELAAGDLIAVWREGGVLTHRLIGWAGGLPLTQGDASPWPDAPADGGAVLGRIVALERGGARSSLETGRWRRLNRLIGVLRGLEARLPLARGRLRRVVSWPLALMRVGLIWLGCVCDKRRIW